MSAVNHGAVTEPREVLAQNVRRFRKANRLTLLDMSLDSGVSDTTLKRIEKRKGNCRLDTLQLLAAFTGLTVAELFTAGSVSV